ncbi:hypothetical protein JCM11251_007228 [Rhodosporidiobolus azoricus]
MLRRLPSLLILLATLVVLVAASPAPVAEAVVPAQGFQLDLSRRFSSTVAALKSKRGPTKTSKAGIKRELTVSDKLLSMLKAATNVLSPAASGSASASARPHPSASSRPRPSASASAPSSWASHAASHAAEPSGSLHPSTVKAAKANVEYVKRKIQEEPWETLDSRLLCPIGETACPIFPRMGTYECLDTKTELESCGGCLSKGLGEDCTAIRGAQGVTCSSGACFVFTCQPGWKLDDEFKRQNGGKGRCKRVGPAGKDKRGFAPAPAGEVQEAA